jgi:deazaflavin-dependent oxidoreductase (nitroreductase family)
MTEFGMGASYRQILTVPGRKTGRLHSTPVDVIEQADSQWLVAGYGPANWVANARAAREVTLSRGAGRRRSRSKTPTQLMLSPCFASTCGRSG